MLSHLLVFLIAVVCALMMTGFVRKLAFRLNLLDHPESRKVHLTPTPLLGGLSLYAAAMVAILWSFKRIIGYDPLAFQQVLGMLSGSTVLIIVGLLDDSGKLHSQFKLFVGIPMAAIALLWGGIRVSTWPGVTLVQDWPQFYEFTSLIVTVVWIVAFTAAFSIFDYMDGLSSGIAAIASVFFLFFAAVEGQYLVGTLSAAILGSSLGFLVWNFNPARIFMGDAGAMFLGFMMAMLAIKLNFLQLDGRPTWLIPILILGVPLMDALLVSISRIRRGLNPLKTPGKDHIAHRLVQMGFHPRAAVILMYLFSTILGTVAVLLYYWSLPAGPVSIVLALAILAMMFLLERIPFEQSDSKQVFVRR